MILDMTKGNPGKIIRRFAVPMLLSVLFQQMYNIVDSMIAGQFVGEDALASVGASYPITMMFMAVAIGINIGCSVVISQLFGARQYREMKTAISTTFFSSAAISLLFTVFACLFCNHMLVWIHTPKSIFSASRIYLNIYSAGLLFLFL